MRPPPPARSNDDQATKIAIFLTREQIKWLSIGLGALPRAIRKQLERELDRQLAEHREVH